MDELLDFLEKYAEYYIDDTPIESDIETDAQMIQRLLPKMRQLISEMSENKTHKDIDKDIEYSIKKAARESVNPNYRYCAADHQIRHFYLTDDISDAMQFAANKSMNGMWYVLEIRQAKDGSYKTFIDCIYSDKHYYERTDYKDFLHFDYIAQCAERIYK